MGGAKYHTRIVLDKSFTILVGLYTSRWLVFFMGDDLVRCEYATFKCLETTKIPSLNAFGSDIRGGQGDHVGVSYLLMEEMPARYGAEGRTAWISGAHEAQAGPQPTRRYYD
jgi:hypothetical protein